MTVAPTVEPLDLADVRKHLRVDHDLDNDYISGLISAARDHIERISQRAIITQTWKLHLDAFPSVIELRRCPVQSATVAYTDTNGDSQTLATSVYKFTASRNPATITLKSGQSWPLVYQEADVVQVTFVCGYGATGASVPATFIHAMKVLIGHWYWNREAVSVGGQANTIPLAFESLVLANGWTV